MIGFANVAWVVLIALPILLAVHFLVTVARKELLVETRRRMRLPERVVYLALIVSLLVLVVTSLYSVLMHGHMRHWLLWAHLAGAGAFTVALALGAVLWSAASRMGAVAGPATGGLRFSPLARLSFWLLVTAGAVSLGTMLAAMLTVFDTEGIRTLIGIHRYAGLAAAVGGIVHLYSLCLGRVGAG